MDLEGSAVRECGVDVWLLNCAAQLAVWVNSEKFQTISGKETAVST
jgi:hypothetical protein